MSGWRDFPRYLPKLVRRPALTDRDQPRVGKKGVINAIVYDLWVA